MRLHYALSFLCFSLFLYSCTKIDTTNLGSGLIPAVDNVTTFDTTLDVITDNLLQGDDTTKIYYNSQLAIGSITNDPLFGPSDAKLYLELKPPNFSAISTAHIIADSVRDFSRFDSVVLCLRYTGGYGDTAQPITFKVFALQPADTLARAIDSVVYNIGKTFTISGSSLGEKMVSLNSLRVDSITVNPSTAINYKTTQQLRISLPNKAFWFGLLKDTSATAALSSDSLFRTKFAGFAITATTNGANAMGYFSIADTATRLQFYYRSNFTTVDTTSTSFYFNPNNCGFANNVKWSQGLPNAEVRNHLNIKPEGDSLIYIKTNPGTQIRIRIPGLQNVSNRIIHRAELKAFQFPPVSNTDNLLLVPPPAIYLERYDTTAVNSFLSIPYDLSPNESYGNCFPSTNGINYSYFGGYPVNEAVNGMMLKTYSFNISRYVQQIVTHQLANSPLRLSANLFSHYTGCTSPAPVQVSANAINYGRTRLGGGALRGVNAPYRMRLRIIYSKL